MTRQQAITTILDVWRRYDSERSSADEAPVSLSKFSQALCYLGVWSEEVQSAMRMLPPRLTLTPGPDPSVRSSVQVSDG
jgi:hypothetical protein